VKAVEGAIAQVDEIEREKLWLLDNSIRRFAHPALDPHFPDWWHKAKENKEARHLVLRLIHLGRQQGGLDIVRTVAFDQETDELSQLIAARALIAIGPSGDKVRYAQHLLAHYADCRARSFFRLSTSSFPITSRSTSSLRLSTPSGSPMPMAMCRSCRSDPTCPRACMRRPIWRNFWSM
jgi:hypothetical protein